MKTLFLIFLISLLTACTGYRDINRDGPSHWQGGFIDKKLDDGLYKIKVESGVSPISHESQVAKLWNRRAKELCNESYQAVYFDIKVVTPYVLGTPNLITKASGYAICKSFKGNISQAKQIIQLPESVIAKQLKIEDTQLVSKLPDGCNLQEMSLDTLEQKGNTFYQNRRYKEALTCFLSVYRLDRKHIQKKQVYQRIGLMYELGYGVTKDIAKARSWYKLSGLI